MIRYLKNNYVVGIKTSPLRALRFTTAVTSVYGLIATFIGINSNLFKFSTIESGITFFLPLALFIFPSFLEESFFRGVLIPNNTKEKGLKSVILISLLSSILFVVWHPLNALTINTSAQVMFLNPSFLIVVFCLGLACSLSYIYSKSLWAPVMIHWLTVVIWVFFLGGRNLILE